MIAVAVTARDEPGDAALLARVAARDADAFEQLYDRHVGTVIALSLRILASRDDAEDVAHEIFRQLWEGVLDYRAERGRFLPWLCAVARNRCIDRVRQGARRAQTGTSVDPDTLAGADSAEIDASRGERRAGVRAALAALPEAQRRAMEVCYFAGLTHREAADRLGVPLGTLKGRVRLAVERLRQDLVTIGGPQ